MTVRRLPSRHQSRSRSSSCGDKHRVAVLAALTLLDTDQHAGAVDVAYFERGNLRHPQPGAISGAECGPVFRPRRRLEQPSDLLDTQDVRELAWVANEDKPSRQVVAIERDGEEEAER